MEDVVAFARRGDQCGVKDCHVTPLKHWTTCVFHYSDGINVEDGNRIQENRRRQAQARHHEALRREGGR